MQQEENKKWRHVLQQEGRFSFTSGRKSFCYEEANRCNRTKGFSKYNNPRAGGEETEKKSPSKKPPIDPQAGKTPKKKASNKRTVVKPSTS
jgi:hypothetical protein